MNVPLARHAPAAGLLADVALARGRPTELEPRLRDGPSDSGVGARMRALWLDGKADLPLPGQGRTLERWQALAAIAAEDLSLAKIYESHTDAVAILSEIEGAPPADGLWAVWAAEVPGETLELDAQGLLHGRKSWCSGAAQVDHGLLTVRRGEERFLAKVRLRHDGVSWDDSGWKTAAMADAGTATLSFSAVPAQLCGRAGAYLTRPGFWQGAAGIAAVWYGAAAQLAGTLAGAKAAGRDPHAAAHLGAVDVALSAARALLREVAHWIDRHPDEDAMLPALRVRAAVEAAASEVLARCGRALGPAALCQNAEHAQRAADLTLFLRQSHAERDLESMGRQLAAAGSGRWAL